MEMGTMEDALLQDHSVGFEETGNIETEESKTGI
jgi:hypothetical protein